LLSHARLDQAFTDVALTHAALLVNMSPVKGVFISEEGDTERPCTPFEKYFGAKPSLSRLRVFGCPVIFKAHSRNGGSLRNSNIIQRGVRGIWCGFPINQAGALIWVDQVKRFIVSADYLCDETFESVLAYPKKPYHDALPVRALGQSTLDPTVPIAHTGPPFVRNVVEDPDAPWTPYTSLPPDHPAPLPDLNEFYLYDAVAEEGENRIQVHINQGLDTDPPPTDLDPDDDDSVNTIDPELIVTSDPTNSPATPPHEPPLPESPISPSLEHLTRDEREQLRDEDQTEEGYDHFESPIISPDPNARVSRYGRAITHTAKYQSYEKALKSSSDVDPSLTSQLLAHASAVLAETIVEPPTIGETGDDPSLFLPEPRNLLKVVKERPEVRDAWVKAFRKEVHGLIITQQAVTIDTPDNVDSVVPVKEVFKCKLDKHGHIDKLKCRIVFRGDLYTPNDPLDSWNPHATWFALRMFCALCARYRIFPAQSDFIMAYLQVKMKERVFIRLPAFWASPKISISTVAYLFVC
jgi:hypothetical protein